jgi:hypothetical protein
MNINYSGIFMFSLPDRAVGDVYHKTYSNGNCGHFWKSIFIIEMRTAEKLKYTYNNEDNINTTNYLKRVLFAVAGVKDPGSAIPPPPPSFI